MNQMMLPMMHHPHHQQPYHLPAMFQGGSSPHHQQQLQPTALGMMIQPPSIFPPPPLPPIHTTTTTATPPSTNRIQHGKTMNECTYGTFLVTLSDFNVELTNQKTTLSSLRMNFANFKQFIISNFNRKNDKYEFNTFNQQFYYQSGMLNLLENRHFVLQCFDLNNLPIGDVIKIDLYSICTGPSKNEHFIESGNSVVGKICFNCQMKQFNDIEISLKNINIILPNQLNNEHQQQQYHLVYGLRNENNLTKNGELNRAYPDQTFKVVPKISQFPFQTTFDTFLNWYNLSNIYLPKTTLTELMDQNLILKLINKQSAITKEFKIPFQSIIKPAILNNSIYSFNYSEGPFSTAMVNGVIEINNIPLFSQMTTTTTSPESRLMNKIIANGNIIYQGVKLPTRKMVKLDLIGSSQDEIISQALAFKEVVEKQPSMISQPTILPTLECSFKEMVYEDFTFVHMLPIEKPLFSKCSVPIDTTPFKYFEAVIQDEGENGKCSVGISLHNEWILSQYISYSSLDGTLSKSGKKRIFGPKFNGGDVIGCGVLLNDENSTVYFTKNGEFLGFTPYRLERLSEVYFSISTASKYMKIHVNFGREPFVFNIHNAEISYFNNRFSQLSSTEPSNIQVSTDYFDRVFLKNGDKRIFSDNPMNLLSLDDNCRAVADDDDNEETEGSSSSSAITTTTNIRNLMEMNEKIIHTLSNPIKIKYKNPIQSKKSQPQEKMVKWSGIKSNKLLTALLNIPKSAFSPHEFVNISNYGQYVIDCDLKPENFDEIIHFNITPTLVIIRGLEALDIKEGTKFLDVGSGCGFVTCLASYLVGENGTITGTDIDEHILDFSREKLYDFVESKYGCNYLNQMAPIEYSRKNLFVPKFSNSIPPILKHDDYEAIFCGLEITMELLECFEPLITEKSKLVASLPDHCLYLFEYQQHKWSKRRILSNVNLPKVKLPSNEEIHFERRERIREYLNEKYYFSQKDINLAMDLIGIGHSNVEVKLCQFLMLYTDPSIRNFNISIDQILYALSIFENGDTIFPTNSHFYLCHGRNLSNHYQLPIKLIEACLVTFNCNMMQINSILDQIAKSKPPTILNEDEEEEIYRNLLRKFSN